MLAKPVDIIKKNCIQVGGTVRIGSGDKVAPVRPSTPSRTAPQGPLQARIVESNSDYAILEVICSCGCKTHIQCNYAGSTKA